MEIKPEEIFEEIASKMVSIIPKNGFTNALLEIKRLPMNVGYTGHYLDNEGNKHWLDIFNFTLDGKFIHQLHNITTQSNPKHIDWNRAAFELHKDHSFNIKYSYDESLEVKN